jgi:TrmH family RNA methyltransferase
MPDTIYVTKADNTFQHLEVLKRNRTKRTQFQEIFVEGVRPIELALENEWPFAFLVFQQGRTLSAWAEDIVDRAGAGKIVSLSPNLMERLSDKEYPSELIAVVRRKAFSMTLPEDIPAPLFVIVDRPGSPGNLGSIVRSCDAFGVNRILIHGHGADPYDPRSIRSSLGTVFSVRMNELISNDELDNWIASMRRIYPSFSMIGTSARATLPVYRRELRGPLVVIFGNETHGMSNHLRELADETVLIPIQGNASSLNVAAAATVVLYERARQYDPDKGS